MAKQVVVGVDGSETSTAALKWAVSEAARMEAVVRAVNVWTTPFDEAWFPRASYDPDDLEAMSLTLLEETISAVDVAGLGVEIESVSVFGDAAQILARRAEDADLLVVGTRGRGGFLGLRLGSVAERCLHHAPCPLVLVPVGGPKTTRQVTVGIDGSEESIAALRWAIDRAGAEDPPVVALYAWSWLGQPPGAEFDPEFGETDALAHLESVLAGAAIAGDAVVPVVVNDLPSPALLNRSGTGDLVVVGSRGRGALTSLFSGSVARQVAHHATTPVVVHRRKDG